MSNLCLFATFCALVLHIITSVVAQNPQDAPPFVMTSIARDAAHSALTAHAASVSALPQLRTGSIPQFFLHEVGARVHGTVVVFHGFGENADKCVEQARYLYKRRFNSVCFNLAGFAQHPSLWISTTLRQSAGYELARKTLLSTPDIGDLIKRFANSNSVAEQQAVFLSIKSPVMPRVLRALKIPALSRARRAFAALAPNQLLAATSAQTINNYFISDHPRYEYDALAKMHLVQALPGPTHAMGYSFGGPSVLRLADASRALSRIVLLAPFFGSFHSELREDVTHFLSTLGTLKLLNNTTPSGNAPLGSISAGLIVSNSARSDRVTASVREVTQTLCILAEDDTSIDVSISLEVCRSKLGGATLVYPSSANIGHLITPENGNKYSDAMMRQIASFFITGRVTSDQLLVENVPTLTI